MRHRLRLRSWCLLGPVVVSLGCHPAPSPEPPNASPTFDPVALLRLTTVLLQEPRTLGHPEREASIAALRARLEREGATVHTQAFDGYDPLDGRVMPLANLFASIRPDAPRQFVLATHFDTRPWAESDPDPARRGQPIPGANDGTSGVVVLLALLPTLRDRLPGDTGFTLAFFDGEELGRPGHGGYCAGSTYFAEHPDEAPPVLERARFGIVLDMVGDAELTIAREPNSVRQQPELVDHVWNTAAALGERAFVDATYPRAILDDHVLLSRAGIPSILLIDYDYDAWHTHADTIDRVSGESLASVARVVFEAVRTQ